jgi:hypothetical protein
MDENQEFHFVTVGWPPSLIEGVWGEIQRKSGDRCSHLMQPCYMARDFEGGSSRAQLKFFRNDLGQRMPEPDLELLTSLEQDGVPTIHNMILSDRVVSRIDYQLALSYATFLARLMGVPRTQSSVVIVASMPCMVESLAVARRMGIPWFAVSFGTDGTGCLCRDVPAARGQLFAGSPSASLAGTAEVRTRAFGPGGITRVRFPYGAISKRLPARLAAVGTVRARSKMAGSSRRERRTTV